MTNCIALATMAFIVGPLSPAQTDQAGEASRRALREQLTTLRLLLVEEIGMELRKLDPDSAKRARTDVDVGGNVGVLWYELDSEGPLLRTSQTRGFYAEGIGAMFTTEVSVPVRPVVPAAYAATPQPPLADSWERARRQVRMVLSHANDGTGPPGSQMTWVMDDVQMDAGIEAAIRVIARHGLNIEQLAADESIIIAVRFVPWVGSFRPPSGSKWTNGANLLELVPQAGLLMRQLQPAELRHVVIRIERSDLKNHQAGHIDFDALRQKIVLSES